jgi:hypothetical protein
MAKHLAIALLVTPFLYIVSVAQNATPSSSSSAADPSAGQTQQNPVPQSGAKSATENQTPSSPRIAAGSIVPVRLTKSIDAKKAKPGDEVLATVTQDLKTNGGEIIVAKDTKVVGHVTEAQARNKEQKESEVGITFDRAESKSGDMNMPMSIQAIIAPMSNPSNNGGGGYDQASPATGGGTATSQMGVSNRTAMGGSPPPAAPSPNAISTTGTGARAENNSRPPITVNTHGVIGMPDLALQETAQNTAQGSLVTSEKGNVKLESGTLMLLRVN